MSTAVAITGIITRTILDLAFIGAGLKLALAVAPRFQVGAPKAPQVRVSVQPETVKDIAASSLAAEQAGPADGAAPSGGTL